MKLRTINVECRANMHSNTHHFICRITILQALSTNFGDSPRAYILRVYTMSEREIKIIIKKNNKKNNKKNKKKNGVCE